MGGLDKSLFDPVEISLYLSFVVYDPNKIKKIRVVNECLLLKWLKWWWRFGTENLQFGGISFAASPALSPDLGFHLTLFLGTHQEFGRITVKDRCPDMFSLFVSNIELSIGEGRSASF